MAYCSISRYIQSLCLYFLLAKLVFLGTAFAAQQTPSFLFQRFDKGSNFESQVALLGDAKVDNGGSFVQLTGSWSSSAGNVMYKKPIKLVGGKTRGKVSFGTYFTFSLSPEAGNGLAFVIVPKGFASHGYGGGSFGLSYEMIEKKVGAFAVEFDTKIDAKYGDFSANHVGIAVGSLISVNMADLSHSKLVLNSGEKLQCWIDYEASSNHVEVRLSRFGEMRPVEPLLSCPIDLSELFKNDEVYLGLSSSNANSKQICKLYSWSFMPKLVPYWMHSQPLHPQSFSKNTKSVTLHKKSNCLLRVFAAVIVGTGFGALGAFLALLAWSLFTNQQPVAPEEFVAHQVEYVCDKVKVLVVDKPLKESKM